MKLHVLVLLLAAVVFVECTNTFLGTDALSKLVFHKVIKYKPRMFQKRVEYFNYILPPSHHGWTIQGIHAYDMTHSGATANVTQGGLGFNHVTLRMKSDRGKGLHYKVRVFASTYPISHPSPHHGGEGWRL